MCSAQADNLAEAFRAIESRLGYSFEDKQLLLRALTHRSFAASNNERLEFLGDAVLDTVIAQHLYFLDQSAEEGRLSRSRAALVNGRRLAELACELSLQDALRLGKGEGANVAVKPSILEGAFEALVGAVFLDSNYDNCYKVFSQFFDTSIDFEEVARGEAKDSKTRLQEWVQAKSAKLPRYKLLNAEGPDHAKKFLVRVDIDSPELSAQGAGTSRKLAEQDAATSLLRQLEERNCF